MNRKTTSKYYFSVEGDTEKWYLDWLKEIINKSEKATCTVEFNRKVSKPVSYVKSLSITSKTEIYHFSDYESQEATHAHSFKDTMDEMSRVSKIGKQVSYRFGYSNLTFELWMILHKIDCNSSLADRKAYLPYINRAYNEDFQSLTEYKREKDFKRCLNKLSFNNVIDAVNRADAIMKRNNDNYTLKQYKNFKYYDENPSLMIHEAIKKILTDCELMN